MEDDQQPWWANDPRTDGDSPRRASISLVPASDTKMQDPSHVCGSATGGTHPHQSVGKSRGASGGRHRGPRHSGRSVSRWTRIRDSFWFLPALLCVVAVVLAEALIFVDRPIDERLMGPQRPRRPGCRLGAARGPLVTIGLPRHPACCSSTCWTGCSTPCAFTPSTTPRCCTARSNSRRRSARSADSPWYWPG